MRRKVWKRGHASCIIMLACAAPFALADSFRWTGNGADDDWDTPANWHCTGVCSTQSYPDDTGDDVVFPSTGAPHSTDLISGTVAIDDWTVEGTVTVSTPTGGTFVVKTDSVTVVGGVMTVNESAKVTTKP